MSYNIDMALDYAAIDALTGMILDSTINNQSQDIYDIEEFTKKNELYRSKLNILKALVKVDKGFYGKVLGLIIEIFMIMGGLESLQIAIRENLNNAQETETSGGYLILANNSKMVYNFIMQLMIIEKQEGLAYRTTNIITEGMVNLSFRITDAEVIAEYNAAM